MKLKFLTLHWNLKIEGAVKKLLIKSFLSFLDIDKIEH